MNYLIGVDVGTSSTKAVLYDQNAQVITQANYGYELHRNAAGMAEQEPEEVINAAEQAIHDDSDVLRYSVHIQVVHILFFY